MRPLLDRHLDADPPTRLGRAGDAQDAPAVADARRGLIQIRIGRA
jgi:hypothetical protein